MLLGGKKLEDCAWFGVVTLHQEWFILAVGRDSRDRIVAGEEEALSSCFRDVALLHVGRLRL